MTLHAAHITFEDNSVPESLRQKEFIQPFKRLVQETFSHIPLLLQMHMPCECFPVTQSGLKNIIFMFLHPPGVMQNFP